MAFNAPSSTLERSSTHYKDGTHSMKWTWTSGNKFTHTISVSLSIFLSEAEIRQRLVSVSSKTFNFTETIRSYQLRNRKVYHLDLQHKNTVLNKTLALNYSNVFLTS